MTVTVSKPALNLREELSALKKPTGIKGEELLRANTVADVYTAINPTMFRNRVINGAMTIDQRNAGGSVSLTGVSGFVLDRWNTVVRPTGGGTITGQQISDAPAGFSNSTRLTVNTADSSLAALDYYFHWQKIEGFNTYDLAFGTANASPVTLSFWVKSSITGQFSTFLTNSSENYSCAIPYTINTANTWERKVITFSGATAGTWVGSTNGAGIIVGFGLTNGTSLLGSPGVWAAAACYGSTGDTNWMATSGNTWQVTGVQLEKGTVATPFEHRPFGSELLLCQRYYEKSYDIGTAIGTSIAGIVAPQIQSGTNYYNNGLPRWMVEKRTTPTVVIYNSNTGTVNSLYNTDTGGNVTISSLTGVNTKGYQYIYSSATAASAGQRLEYHYTVSAEL
jgi:hypothetical protein